MTRRVQLLRRVAPRLTHISRYGKWAAKWSGARMDWRQSPWSKARSRGPTRRPPEARTCRHCFFPRLGRPPLAARTEVPRARRRSARSAISSARPFLVASAPSLQVSAWAHAEHSGIPEGFRRCRADGVSTSRPHWVYPGNPVNGRCSRNPTSGPRSSAIGIQPCRQSPAIVNAPRRIYRCTTVTGSVSQT